MRPSREAHQRIDLETITHRRIPTTRASGSCRIGISETATASVDCGSPLIVCRPPRGTLHLIALIQGKCWRHSTTPPSSGAPSRLTEGGAAHILTVECHFI